MYNCGLAYNPHVFPHWWHLVPGAGYVPLNVFQNSHIIANKSLAAQR